MDLKTGRIYRTRQEAIDAGVPSADVLELSPALQQLVDEIPRARLDTSLKFSKGSFKPVATAEK